MATLVKAACALGLVAAVASQRPADGVDRERGELAPDRALGEAAHLGLGEQPRGAS